MRDMFSLLRVYRDSACSLTAAWSSSRVRMVPWPVSIRCRRLSVM